MKRVRCQKLYNLGASGPIDTETFNLIIMSAYTITS